MEVIPLRKKSRGVDGRLVNPFPIVNESKLTISGDEPPRALKSLAAIVENDLCHRCGSCVGICPTNVLGVDEDDFPVVKNLSACTDCDLCVKVCPGDDFDAPTFSKELYGYVPDVHDVYGHFEKGYLTHSTDKTLRLDDGTSGGFVTAFLASLLKRGIIDGAVVIDQDKDIKWKGVPKIARTEAELISAAKSKYAITPTNAILGEILDTPGKYALVGLPCQIHGFHKASKLDKRLKERVVVTVGLICHAALEHDALRLMWDGYGDHKKDVKKFVYRVGKHPGTTFSIMNDGSTRAAMFPDAKTYRPDAIEMMNILYRLYTPSRCFTCYDSMVEFADIACGDPWMIPPTDEIDFKNGYTFVITRNKKAEHLLHGVRESGELSLLELSREQTKTSNYTMGREKRERAWRLNASRKAEGRPVPDYGFEIPEQSRTEKFKVEVNLITHIFSFKKAGRDALLGFLLSPIGYVLFYLNNRRRRVRYLIKKRLTRMRQKNAPETAEVRQW